MLDKHSACFWTLGTRSRTPITGFAEMHTGTRFPNIKVCWDQARDQGMELELAQLAYMRARSLTV